MVKTISSVRQPLVSVLLPARDCEATIERAIESIRNQTLNDFELLIADDASTDCTGKILNHLKRQDLRIRSLRTKSHRGIVGSLQALLAIAKGRFIARMDGDDVSRPDRLERQLLYMEANPELSGCGCQIEYMGNGMGFKRYVNWLNKLCNPERILAERFIESPIAHPTLFVEKTALEEVGAWRESNWAEDYDLILRFLEKGHRLGKVPYVLFDWYDSSERLTRTDPRYSEDNFLRAKAHFLSRVRSVQARGVIIAGAGPIGKTMAKYLGHEEISVHAHLEVNQNKFGRVIGGIKVLPAEPLPVPSGDSPVQLIALGRPHQRDAARLLFRDAGWREGEDLFCVA